MVNDTKRGLGRTARRLATTGPAVKAVVAYVRAHPGCCKADVQRGTGAGPPSNRTETIYTYICDLCGSEHGDQSEITHVYLDKPEGGARGMRDRRYQVDVCDHCLSRPIADVLTFCRGYEHEKPSRRGVVRIADH